MIKVLFVCTGNICRSPTAHGIFRDMVANENLDKHIEIDSAGTGNWHTGDAPDGRSVRIAFGRGIDLTDLRARPIKKADFENFDYIYAMDDNHMHTLKRIQPHGSHAQLEMFANQDIPDPWYGEEKGFTTVFDMIEEGAQDILTRLRAKHKL